MALKIRAMLPKDVAFLRAYHQTFFPELDVPDYYRMLGGFVIEDENGHILMGGGVKMIGEAELSTDQSASNIKLGKALVLAQGACIHICQKYGIRDLHALVYKQEDYIKHLKQHGFELAEEKLLTMKVPRGQ